MPIGTAFTYVATDVGLIPVSVARTHLRVEADYPLEQIEPYLYAAEEMAVEFLNRKVYRDQDALTAAIAAVPAALQAAADAHTAAIAAANLIDDVNVRAITAAAADKAYTAAQSLARETYAGVVINSSIAGAILLLMRCLFENRSQMVVGTIVAEISVAAHNLLQPFREGMGV